MSRRGAERRGKRIGTHKDKTASRMRHRSVDPRVQGALSAAREAQAALDARMALERAEQAVQRLQQAGTEVRADSPVKSAREAAQVLAAEIIAEGRRRRWSLGEARNLVREGYTIEGTVRRTGWPARMLRDVRPGVW